MAAKQSPIQNINKNLQQFGQEEKIARAKLKTTPQSFNPEQGQALIQTTDAKVNQLENELAGVSGENIDQRIASLLRQQERGALTSQQEKELDSLLTQSENARINTLQLQYQAGTLDATGEQELNDLLDQQELASGTDYGSLEPKLIKADKAYAQDLSLIRPILDVSDEAGKKLQKKLIEKHYGPLGLAAHQNSITTKDFFCEKMKEMDLRIDDIIICYDQKGIFSSPRVWFNFKIFGAKNVFVLNGGFKNCEQENIEIERLNQSVIKVLNQSSPYRLTPPNSLSYNYKKDDYRVCNLERIFEISEGICRRKEKKNIIDLRKIEEEESNNQTEVTKEKYETEELDEKEIFENFEQAQIKEKEIKEQSFPQNMKWNSRRQIAGSESISYTKFVKSDSTFKSKKELSELFDDLGK